MGKGENVAYVRVSSVDQNEERQVEALKKYDIDKWFVEKISGKDTNRPELQKMLSYIREGDTVYVKEFSRLGRSTADLLNLVQTFEDKGVKFVSLSESFNTSTPAGRLQMTMMAAIAEFERSMIKERQREGIELAKKQNRYPGRPRKLISDELFEQYYDLYMTHREITKEQIAFDLHVSRATLYFREKKYLEEHPEKVRERAPLKQKNSEQDTIEELKKEIQRLKARIKEESSLDK